jgi:hypothetical protein
LTAGLAVSLALWVAAAFANARASRAVTLGALDVLPVVQVGTAMAGGAWWAWTLRAQTRAYARALAERDGLAIPERVPRRTVFVATLYVLCVAIALSACFTGQAIWSLVG